MLHKSQYYKEDIVKYFKCKKCERARLAKMRDSHRYTEVDGCCCYCCPKCRGPISLDSLYDLVGEGGWSYYNCRCGSQCRLRHRKKEDPRTLQTYHPAQLKCEWCNKFTCNATSAFMCHKGQEAKSTKKVPPLVLKLSKK